MTAKLRLPVVLATIVGLAAALWAIGRVGHEGQAGLGKVEALADALEAGGQSGKTLRQTLAGAMITLSAGRVTVVASPRRRR